MTQTPDAAARVAQSFMGNVGVSDVAGLRRLDADAIVAAQLQTARDMFAEMGAMPFHPVVDGSLIPATPSEILRGGTAADIDVLIGATAQELRLFMQELPEGQSEQILHAMVGRYIEEKTGAKPPASAVDAVVKGYRQAAEGTSWTSDTDILTAINTYVAMQEPIQRIADYRANAGARTYMYDFRWCSQADPDRGAFHAIDLPFVFDSFHVDGWREFIGADHAAEALGRGIRSAWAAFARTGDPSTVELGPWSPYDLNERTAMILDTTPALAFDPHQEQRSRWRPIGGGAAQ